MYKVAILGVLPITLVPTFITKIKLKKEKVLGFWKSFNSEPKSPNSRLATKKDASLANQ